MQMSCKNDKTREVLRAASLRRTQARQAVLTTLTSARRPLSQQQIAAARGLETIDKVTIYRTLAALKSAGLLHVVHGADGTAMFCANHGGSGCPGGHPHFQCLECGVMRCVRDQRLPHLAIDEAAVVTAKQLTAFGVCAACAKKAENKASVNRRRRIG